MKRLFLLPTLEHATYSWPCEKQGSSNWSPATFRVCPCDLLMDMAKQGRIGNWSLLNSKGRSSMMSGILGMKTSSPFALPQITVASITWAYRFFTTNLVPLHSFGGWRFLSSIIGVPFFRLMLWDGTPGSSREFRNSTGYSTASVSWMTLSTDL